MAVTSIEKVDVHHHFIPAIYMKGTTPFVIRAISIAEIFLNKLSMLLGATLQVFLHQNGLQRRAWI
jgi:hypothetical protein